MNQQSALGEDLLQDPPILDQRVVRLRLLATTDLHMQLLGFDYVANRPLKHHGLAGIAHLIATARDEARRDHSACLLLDNGDLLQGNAMGEHLARKAVDNDHPIVACLNHLEYDAIGLGNHDLDYGLGYLEAIAGALRMPVVCSNLRNANLPSLRDSAMITCPVSAPDGAPAGHLQVGILSVLPEQTAIWNHASLDGHAEVEPSAPALRRRAADLRAKGADLVVVLAHMGIGHIVSGQESTDSAVSLSEIEGVDAMIIGHTHRRFPGNDHKKRHGVDTATGTLGKMPAIMPGYGASDLAVMDLNLVAVDSGGWSLLDHHCALRPNATDVPEDARIRAFCKTAHTETCRMLAEVVGRTDVPLHNYFSMLKPTATCALTARAKAQVIREALRGTSYADLPLLAGCSAHTAGGRSGPRNFLNIPIGGLQRRHLSGLSPYVNHIWAVRVTGEELRHWLEHASQVYRTLLPDTPGQVLIDEDFPSFHFDTIFGLSYEVDLTRPVGARICALSHAGRAVSDRDAFVLCTNQFRARGGGGYQRFADDQVILRSDTPLEAALQEALTDPEGLIWPDQVPWALKRGSGIESTFHTAPDALNHLGEIESFAPRADGITKDGFARICLTF